MLRQTPFQLLLFAVLLLQIEAPLPPPPAMHEHASSLPPPPAMDEHGDHQFKTLDLPNCPTFLEAEECTKNHHCRWVAKPPHFGSDNKCRACPMYEKRELNVFGDQICLVCHEMFSDTKPNYRHDCVQNCYSNSVFKECINIFKPTKDGEGDKVRKIRELMGNEWDIE